MAGPQNRPIDPSFWGLGGHVHYLPQCYRQKQDVTEVVPPPPDHACCLSIRLGEWAAPLAVPLTPPGPPNRPVVLGVGGVTCSVMHHLPPKSAVAEGIQRAQNHGFSHVVVSRLHLENMLNAIVTWADRHSPSHKFHIVCT